MHTPYIYILQGQGEGGGSTDLNRNLYTTLLKPPAGRMGTPPWTGRRPTTTSPWQMPLSKCHTGLSTAMPLVASMLTQALAALLVAALADELGHEAVGADVDRDAARRAPARPVPALGPELPLARRHGRRGRGGREKNEVERQVEVSSVARALWKNHSAE